MFEGKLNTMQGTKMKLIGSEKIKLFLCSKSHQLLTSM
jgi:hypothetical protein